MIQKHIIGLSNVPKSLQGCVLTIGNFDGVHRGHQQIISVARKLAERHEVPVVAMTFDPPPDLIVRPDDAPQRLVPHEMKVSLLLQAGVDIVITAQPDRTMLSMPASDFLHKIIVGKFAPRDIVEGHNFFFGHGRAGTVETLKQAGASLGYEVHLVEPVQADLQGETVRISSTLIRQLILEGRVENVTDMLGRPFAMSNTVVVGAQLGRVLEFPTANMEPGQQIVPRDGVYAGRGEIQGINKKFPAAISIGSKPTFGENPRVIETNLLGASGNFYGLEIKVEFLARLRDQQKFESAEALKIQIAKDIQYVKEHFDTEQPPNEN